MLYGLIVIACICLVFLWARFVEPNWIELRREQVVIRDLPPEFDGVKVTVISDLHFPRWSTLRLVRRAIHLSNRTRPDIVLFLGDFCARGRHESRFVPPLGSVFSDVRSRLGIFGVLGNHDHAFEENAVKNEIKSSSSVQLIENESVVLGTGENRLAFVGVGDLWAGEVDLTKAFSGISPTVPRILLSHNPDVAEELGNIRVDLQISGHTHGGQIYLPFLSALKVPSKFGNKYRAGLVSAPTHPVYINRGICSVKRLRFCCRPEVTLLTLRCSEC
jgi:uncharacterized protein